MVNMVNFHWTKRWPYKRARLDVQAVSQIFAPCLVWIYVHVLSQTQWCVVHYLALIAITVSMNLSRSAMSLSHPDGNICESCLAILPLKAGNPRIFHRTIRFTASHPQPRARLSSKTIQLRSSEQQKYKMKVYIAVSTDFYHFGPTVARNIWICTTEWCKIVPAKFWELSQNFPKLADWAVHGWSSFLAALGAGIFKHARIILHTSVETIRSLEQENYIFWKCTVLVLRMANRKWKETMQQPSMLSGPAVPGCYLVSFHILLAILSTSTVFFFHLISWRKEEVNLWMSTSVQSQEP